jgi:hypothetical protein
MQMDVIQPNSNTGHMRILNWLLAARKLFQRRGRAGPLRILSFGCSIGDEVATILQIFPDADVHGVDAQDAVLDIAQRTLGHLPNVHLYRSDMAAIMANGPFDMIVCSAVLCINPAPADYAVQFPFSRFADVIAGLDAALAPGGVLAIVNAGYRFADTVTSNSYRVIRSDVIFSAGFVDVFNKSGSHYLQQMRTLGLPIYRKRGNCSSRHDEDLADSLFEKIGEGEDRTAEMLLMRPVPEDSEEIWSIVRCNLDAAKTKIDASYLPVTYTYSFMRAPSGQEGYSVEVAWPSFQTGEWHRRPAYWNYTIKPS